MSINRLSSVFIVIVFFISVPSISSQNKNRVAVSEADRIKLYEFNSVSKEFDLVWESADISLNRRMGSQMRDMHIVDIDNDGRCELIAVDHYGIFIWGKNGKYPQYFAFQGPLVRYGTEYILAVDIDDDSRMELLTQRMNLDHKTRIITVWKIDSDRLSPINEIELPGTASWSLRQGDFDGDGKTEILTSANLIHILGWKDEELVIEAEFPNLAGVIDNVRPADIDADGVDEIIASGNSGCFSVYKHRKIHDKSYYPLYFQSKIEPGRLNSMTQGLHYEDIDGDGIKEILVGLTSWRGEKGDNILVYKSLLSHKNPIGSIFSFEKVFSIPQASSFIPGFVIGDVDNDGQNEVIYNNKFILRFNNDADGNMSSESMGEISKSSWSVAIGPFYPSGEDKPHGLRLIPIAVTIDLDEGEYIESGKSYEIMVKLKSSWHDVSQIRLGLECNNEAAVIEPTIIHFNVIDAGQEVGNTEQPFILRAKSVEKFTPFELNLVIETESGYRIEQNSLPLRSKSYYISPSVRPELKRISETIAISSEEGIYEDLGISPEYFNYNIGLAWPSSTDLNSYKNLILYDDGEDALWQPEFLVKLKSFLDNGGNCFLQGYYLIPTIEDLASDDMKDSADFINSYLHVRYLDETNQLTGLKGQSGDVITDGLNFDLKINQDGNSPGVLESLASAIPILFYPNGQVAGVRIDGPYKMVILPFYLNDIESVEVRKELLQRILAWFDQE